MKQQDYDVNHIKRASFSVVLSVILCDDDFDEPYPNSFSFIAFVDLQGESLAKHQSVIVASGPHEASVMRSVARAPSFIQLESEDKLTGVERVARFWCDWVVRSGGQGCSRHSFKSITGCAVNIIPFIRSFKPDKPYAV